jgi:hypothetical protein
MAATDTLVGVLEVHAATRGSSRLYTWLRDDGRRLTEAGTLTFSELREQSAVVCCALRRQWQMCAQTIVASKRAARSPPTPVCRAGREEGARAMLIYPPGLDLLVAFFGCQYAHVLAVPYYPPQLPETPLPGASARRLLADGLEKLARVVRSCAPVAFLSCRAYLRAQSAFGLVLRGADVTWPAEWRWHATDALPRKLSADDAAWLADVVLPCRLAASAGAPRVHAHTPCTLVGAAAARTARCVARQRRTSVAPCCARPRRDPRVQRRQPRPTSARGAIACAVALRAQPTTLPSCNIRRARPATQRVSPSLRATSSPTFAR